MRDNNIYIYPCPHCDQMVQTICSEVNCRIFRHGAMIAGQQQLNPHLGKPECDRLAIEGLIYGCGKPYELYPNGSGVWSVRICDYI